MTSIYDVAIIGGGPAGSTVATLLARKGRSVIVIEREKFPRFHIGESLLPYSMDTLDRLGVREEMERRFMPKHGAEIATACGAGVKFYFKDGFRLKHHSAYQVTRSEFDKMLLDHADANGAKVMEETAVQDLAFDSDGVTLKLQSKDSAPIELRAKYLIDASGRNAVVATHLSLKRRYEHLNKFSVYAHYDHVDREPGIDATLTRLVQARDWWFWMIPLGETKMSIGMVMETSVFKARKQSPEELLDQALREQPMIWDRMSRATRASPVYSTGDYSYRNTQITGDRWLLAGDAAGFIDPIFSTGVFLAVHSAEMAADAIDTVLDHPGRRQKLFGNYAKKIGRVMKLYLRFVENWYTPRFIELFVAPTQHLQLAPAVNAILAGNIGNSFAIWWRLQVFYFVLFLQRFIPLVPRLTLIPKPQTT